MNGLYYTFNMKSSGKYKRMEEGECLCTVAQNHERSVVELDHFRDFKGV